MMDMFSLNNIYILTDKIHEFIADSEKNSFLTQIKNSIILEHKAPELESFD